MKLIILGAPGSGKGTQATRICKAHGIAHVSTGDLLRKNIADGTELGKKAKAFMDAGALVPDDLVIALLKNRIAEKDCQKGFLLDGFPRNRAQAEALGKIIEVDAVIYLDLDLGLLAERISARRVCPACGYSTTASAAKDGKCQECGAELIIRDDDKLEVVQNRLKVYAENTAPLVEYYKSAGILLTIDGSKSIDGVNADIEAALK